MTIIFDSKTPSLGSGATPAADQVWPEQRQANTLYDHAPADADGFYPIENTLDLVFTENLTKLSDRTGMSLEAQATERREFSTVMTDAGLHKSPVVAELIHNAWTQARLDGDEVDVEAALATTNEDTRRALREQWGAKDAEDLTRRAQKLVKQHPKLAAILATGTVGSRLDVVSALVQHVRDVNFR